MGVADLADYPWDAVAPFAATAHAHPGGAVDLSVGSPIDPTPRVVSDALREASDAPSYPATAGTERLREAVAAWYARVRGVPGLTAEQVLPTIGSKEFVALLPLLLGLGPGDVVVHPRAAYPTYEVGARLVGAEPVAEDDPERWPARTRLVWINSPGNPDGRVWDAGLLAIARGRARALGAVLAGDECYAELGWDSPWDRTIIPSVLDPAVAAGRLDGLLSVSSLSKRSNLAGYRAAFVAGDAVLIARLTTARKHLGLMVPAPVQTAMAAALADDDHVRVQKERYRRRRDALLSALAHAGFRVEGSAAGLYLWATLEEDCWRTMGRLAEIGILGGPGAFYGPVGAQHVRLALTATDERVAAAADRLGAVSWGSG